MAITFGGGNKTAYQNATNRNPPLPAGLAAGDLTLSMLYIEATKTITFPTGFTTIHAGVQHTPGNNFWLHVAYRFWQSGDGNPSWSWSVSADSQAANLRVLGVDQTTPLDGVTPVTQDGDGTNVHVVTAGLTTLSDNAAVMLLTGNYAGGAYSATTLAELYETAEQFGFFGAVQASAGASGAESATGPTTDYIGLLFSLRAAVAETTPPKLVIARQAAQRASVR